MAKRFKNFKIGHVERVFTNKEDMVWYAGSADKAERSTSQIILLSPTAGLLPSMKNRRYARPLLRGVSDSITRGDLVLYTTIARKRFYLGPLNTDNNVNFNEDNLFKPENLPLQDILEKNNPKVAISVGLLFQC